MFWEKKNIPFAYFRYVKSFPDCIIDQSFHVNAFCNKYADVLETNFGGYVQVLVDKYTYNGTCYGDYDYGNQNELLF